MLFSCGCAAKPGADLHSPDEAGPDAPVGRPSVPDTDTDTDASPDEAGPMTPTGPEEVLLRLVAVGDYGTGSDDELAVAELVERLSPDAVLTLGDNIYDWVTPDYDELVGQYYQGWMAPYDGDYGAGSPDGVNRFWPCLGNHDWDAGIDVWYDYFELPGNERYYSVLLGEDGGGAPLVDLYCVDSDEREPDGNTATSAQGAWLQGALAASVARWQIVVVHHPPWSSGWHGSQGASQWPYAVWGADLVLQGHEHLYERLVRDGEVFVTDGRGGAKAYSVEERLDHSQVAADDSAGATLVEVREGSLLITALDTADAVVDRVEILPDRPLLADSPLVRFGSEWRYDASDAPPEWTEPGFDDLAWAVGHGQLGYGDGDEAGSVADGGERTVRFRQTFDVVDPLVWEQLEIELLRDDGAAVYLNGVEVLRSNLPDGVLGGDVLAVDEVSGDAEDVPVTALVPAGALVAGANVVAVEVHQISDGSSDLSFDLALRGVHKGRLVPAGATWSYLDAGEPPAGWTSASDVSAWATGPAPVGTAADAATSVGPATTVWLRTDFEVADRDSVGGLLLEMVRDDGAIVYLNGVEVTRFGLPGVGVEASTPATYDVEPGWEAAWPATWIDSWPLVPGTNTLAVEVHRASTSDSLRFDLSLSAVGP